MAKRGKLFKKGASYIVERSVGKIEASKDLWASATIEGFRTDWSVWMTQFVEPQLRGVVSRLPPKTADVRANVVNRVVPVAETIKSAAQRYRLMKVSGVVAVPAAPRIPVAPTA
jgi:hypothetical protein